MVRSNTGVSLSCWVVHSLSCVWLFATLWTAACQTSLSFTIFWSLLRVMSIKLLMLSNHLILCFPLLLLALIFLSIRVVSKWVSSLNQMAKASELNFIISPSNEYSGLISFRIDWFHLLAVQQTCKSLLQHPSSKASVLRHSPFFMVQLSLISLSFIYDYWKNHSFNFVGKLMSLLLNTLSSFIMAFLPRSRHLLISCLQSPSTSQENKVCHCFHCFPIYLPWSDRIGFHDLHFLNVEF